MARALTGALTGAEVATVVFDRALAELGASSVGLWMVESGAIRFVGGAGVTDTVVEALMTIAMDSDMPAAKVISTGHPVLLGSKAVRNEQWPSLRAIETESRALAVLPLSVPGRTFGCLHIGYPQEMTDDDFNRPFLDALAELASAALDRARRHERERELAHVLQQLLLPAALPTFDRLEVSARYLTARSEAEAGGDFYDLVRLPSGRAGFVIGDVEGHDATAAATMGQLRSALRALAGQYRDPGAVMDALRWSWDLLGYSRMATCLIGRVDPANGEVAIAAAGHLPPVFIDVSGRAVLVPIEPSPPLGVASCPTVEKRFSLGPGDTLFLYTDGLVENRRNPIDDELEALRTSLEGRAADSLEQLCDEVISSHAAAGDRPDDIAILALRRRRVTIRERRGS